jgi:hypothetical protein
MRRAGFLPEALWRSDALLRMIGKAGSLAKAFAQKGIERRRLTFQ